MDNTAAVTEADEISLTDLFKILLKRKKTFIWTFFVIVMLTLVVALIKPKTYTYNTSIEIGTTVKKTAEGFDTVLIDQPDTVKAKLEHSYIPFVIQQYRQDHPEEKVVYKISAEVPKGSEVVVLSAKGTEKQAEAYITLEKGVVKKLIGDHKRLFDIARSQLESEMVFKKLDLAAFEDEKTLDLLKKGHEQKIQNLKNKLKDLQSSKILLANNKKRYERNIKSLRSQIAELSSNISETLKNRSKAKERVQSGSDAMTLLLIDNEVQQHRNQMTELKRQVEVDIESKIESTQNEIQSVGREIDSLRNNILIAKIEMAEKVDGYQRSLIKRRHAVRQAETQVENSQQTHSLVEPMQSVEAVGMGKKAILLLGIFLGGFVALFAVFIHEFLSNVRQQVKEANQ